MYRMRRLTGVAGFGAGDNFGFFGGNEGPPEGAGRPVASFQAGMVGPVLSAILCGLSQAWPGEIMIGQLFLRWQFALVHLQMAND